MSFIADYLLPSYTLTVAGVGLYDVFIKRRLNTLPVTALFGTLYLGGAAIGCRMLYEARKNK